MGKTRSRRAASPSSNGVTLDAGALIALDRGERRMIALLELALSRSHALRVPAGVVGQVWRDGRRQATLARFLRAAEVQIVPLDEQLSKAAGELCGHTATNDVIDASVVLIARKHRDVIITSDPADLRCLDPSCALTKV